MKQLSINNAHLGEIVWLTHPKPTYSINETNPLVDTLYECSGRITSILPHQKAVTVKWDNKETNAYNDLELSCHNSGPTTGYHSIW